VQQQQRHHTERQQWLCILTCTCRHPQLCTHQCVARCQHVLA
jgi:hypothetical protein